MKEMLIKRLGNLLTIKSLVTMIMLILFCILALKGVTNEQVNNIFLMIISFYFGTQTQRKKVDEWNLEQSIQKK